ncbi:hypothetical protein [Nocardioides sp. YIM 152315]|uniref:hypothetical protein n=1 Tax=Nocardioides sp. YIM 152315 TaxID=3031760 RepID=UPI0023DB41AB|nr:hypothetical protein [Nocardioides sp. YIM 152315]MDF1603401.1 hypothetical protein [Nocardioides sp. YIM 152315]
MQRRRMLALARYRADVCSGCGFHSSIADEDPLFKIEDRRCPICADTAPAMRARNKAEGDAAAKAAPEAHLPSDGRTSYLRLLTPAEVMAHEANRKPRK